ncbi:hypothetical protein ACEPAF_1449 [Sanghuangporus sanghuang]
MEEQWGDVDDLETSIMLSREVLELQPEGHPYQFSSLCNQAIYLTTSFERLGRMEDLDEAITLHRAALELRTDGHTDRSVSLGNLANSLRICFEHRGRMDDLEEAIALDRAALALQPDGHPYHSISLSNVEISLWTRFGLCGRMEDLEEAVTLERAALVGGSPSITLNGTREDGGSRRGHRTGTCLPGASTGRFEDLEKAVALARAALALRLEGHPLRSASLTGLAECLYLRFQKEGSIDDFEESIESLNCAAAHTFSSFSSRLESNRLILAFKLLRWTRLRLPLTRAISFRPSRFLEQGRALLWSQIRGLRTPLDQLAEVDKALAERFEGCSRRLEALIASSGSCMSGSETDECGSLAYGTSQGRNPADQMFVKMRRLSEEQEAIINEIRRILGFEGFLRSAPFDVLQQAASERPVIMLNLSKYRSDALIVLPSKDEPCVCISPDPEFYSDSVELHRELIRRHRESGIGSGEYDEILRRVMKVLWDGVVWKVIQKLKEIGITEGSRIWWCPTSILTAFPFHAAGPYKDPHGNTKYLLDDYISSYTPTLSSLINARSGARGEDGRMLFVSDTKLPSANRERHSIRHFRRRNGLHFVCHGILAEDPFESSLKLPGGNLTVLDIARAHLPNAEFAFLSACHTAEQGPTSALDESLSLTAAMQFCGFRSVVGTMRQLLDRDGPFLAKFVYGHLMYGLEEGEMRFKGAVAAVREAALSLREWKDEGRNGEEREVMTERWVNLVHIGA